MCAALFALCLALIPATVFSAEGPTVRFDMPDGIANVCEKSCRPVMLMIDRAGVSWVNGHAVPRDQLGKTLSPLIGARPEHCRRLIIQADADTPYGDILNVLSLIRRAGIAGIGLVEPTEAE